MSEEQVSIVIPNWNGKTLLKECLPSVIRAIEACGNSHEIIIVDDGSSDGSSFFVRSRFPGVRVIELPANVGFAEASNAGIKTSTSEIVVLLNNDMLVSEDFLPPLVGHFSDNDVFAVSPKIIVEGVKNSNEAVNKAKFYYGQFSISWPEKGRENKAVNLPTPILYACGGAAAFDRKKYLELGGFDNLFYPFYGEDVDICYRAWKRGWRVYYEPSSKVVHKYQGTIGREYTSSDIQFVKYKNHFLFMWKNITDRWFIFQGAVFLPARLIRAAVLGNFAYIKAFFTALSELGIVREKKAQAKLHEELSDREVLRPFLQGGRQGEDFSY